MKYWVFDLDGTLVDSLTTHFNLLKRIFAHFGVEFTDQDQQEILKVTATTLLKFFESKLGIENASAAKDMFHSFTEDSLQEIKAFSGIELLLKSLTSNGRQLAVWTARDLDATMKILKHTGLEPYFSICISGSCTTEGKPHPEGLQRIATHFGSEPDSMVMVGDFDSDMLGAQAFGIKAIRVAWHSAVPALKCKIAHRQFNKVADLHSWIHTEYLAESNTTIVE